MYQSIFKKLFTGALAIFLLVSCALSVSGLEPNRKSKRVLDGTVLPIIMYHEVKPYKTRKDVITPAEIESDLNYLNANHYTTITMTDLIDYANSKKELPQKPIIISFDDGYYNTYYYVFPLLKKYNIKIVLSIIGKNTDDATQFPENNMNYSHVTWDQANEMKDSGLVEIQNHTYNLHTITRKRFGCKKNKTESLQHYEQILTEDIGKLQQEITAMTATTPNTFTYPYGRASKESYPIIKKLGFQASLTCDYGLNIIGKDPSKLYGLKRVCRVHGVSLQKTLKDVMKTLKYR